MTPLERFHLNYLVDAAGCWIWQRATAGKMGYGAVKIEQKQYAAHRFAYLHLKGPIPEGALVCHSCDVPRCVNPDHLFLGTVADNARDMTNKNRQARGVANGRSKLLPNQVLAIRASREPEKTLARRFSVAAQTIKKIRTGKNWGWLKEGPDSLAGAAGPT